MPSPATDRHRDTARALLDRAAAALAVGAASGRFRLELPCQGRHLQEPVRTYSGSWEDVPAELPTRAAVRAQAATWPRASREAYAHAVAWLDQVPDRVEKLGLWGRFVVELAGDP